MKLISLNAVCSITGYECNAVLSLVEAKRFPEPVEKRKNTLMFNSDDVFEWDEINRQKLLPGKDVAALLNISINELIALNDSCYEFPFPVVGDDNPFNSKWNLGEILDWRAKYWRSF